MAKQGDMNKPNIITDFYYSLSVTDRCKIMEKITKDIEDINKPETQYH